MSKVVYGLKGWIRMDRVLKMLVLVHLLHSTFESLFSSLYVS